MVDFTGAVYIKLGKLRSSKIVKAYISIFVCMSVKAVHIELVNDLSAEAFLGALRRFVARRGEVKNIYSDNATNFTASNRILQDLSEKERDEFEEKIANELSHNGIMWHFSPPGAPHFNGLVEAGVNTVKTHMVKALGNNSLTFEEMTTLLAQVEAAINSRPLIALPSDPSDEICALTPAHFVFNASPSALPDEDLMEIKTRYLTRWKVVQKAVQ
ncbi:uncharacterized protein LOC116346288 [Contarinia nasturtii]|uniref:uncharacterized protein LOC116346288 n=1 Tax=Contarinia nasturtii TaxID=265458 RepID=UPI0012D3E0CC|nr:uncharacterized protein LOC116346288 [Contarinia nasturtii]